MYVLPQKNKTDKKQKEVNARKCKYKNKSFV